MGWIRKSIESSTWPKCGNKNRSLRGSEHITQAKGLGDGPCRLDLARRCHAEEKVNALLAVFQGNHCSHVPVAEQLQGVPSSWAGGPSGPQPRSPLPGNERNLRPSVLAWRTKNVRVNWDSLNAGLTQCCPQHMQRVRLNMYTHLNKLKDPHRAWLH